MTLLRLGVLFTVPFALLAQAPVTENEPARGDGPQTSTLAGMSAAPLLPLTPGQKVKRRAWRVVEPLTLVGSAFSAGIDQWADVPHQWGRGLSGYSIRLASAEGVTVAHNGIALGFDLAFRLDPRYHRMPGGTAKARLWNAVSQTFIAYKDTGGRTINVSEIAGNFGAGFVANTWEPPGYNGTGDALSRGASGLAFHTLKNVIREFLPDILHPGKNGTSGKMSGGGQTN